MNETVTLTIEKLAGLGDGMAMHEGEKIFVPYTLPGDVVRARIVRRTKEAVWAVAEEILTPGENRVAPPCGHFSRCGGCALQHFAPALYTDFKQQTAREAVRKAGFDPDLVQPIISLPAASRRRVELKISEGKLGFYAERSHRLIDIKECKVLEPALERLVLAVKPQLIAQKRLFSVQINGVDDGYDVLLSGDGSEKPQLAGDEGIIRLSVQAQNKTRILFETAPVTITLGEVKISVPPGAFLQASREAQAIMTQHVLEGTAGAKTVLDLFAGIGTYSFPLAARAAVAAMETDAPMVAAMQAAARRHGLEAKVNARRRDLFRDPLPAAMLNRYDAIVINPPRAGAREQTAEIACSDVKRLVMVSCNPATFTRDAGSLKEGGYHLVKCIPIDQFSYSAHLEIIAEFSK